MPMTKSDYNLLAEALKKCKPAEPAEQRGWATSVHAIARVCEQTNARFEIFRFIVACGAGEEPAKRAAR